MTPECTAEVRYWRNTFRWVVVLQVMYYVPGTGRGSGPYFVLGYRWSESRAAEFANEQSARLMRSENEIAKEMRRNVVS